MFKFIKKLHKKNIITKSKNSRGFTILETLIAVTILVFAITGPLSLVAGSIRSSGYAKDSITAFYLAQEAIEYVRNTRDINTLRDISEIGNWLDFIENNNGVGDEYNCMNDYGSELNKCSLQNDGTYQLSQCDPSDCTPLSFSSVEGTIPYGSVSTGESQFIRNIWLEKVPNFAYGGESSLTQVIVNVHIKWRSGNVENDFLIREYLTNWKSEA